MKKCVCLFAGLYLAAIMGVSAQERDVIVERDTIRSVVEKEVELLNPYAPYIPYAWNEGWFLQLGGGAQVYWNQGVMKGTFGGNIAPVFQLSAAKWLFPYLGVRFQFQGFQMNGYTKSQGWYTPSKERGAEDWYPYSTSYNNFHFDLLWNTSKDFTRTSLKPSVYSLIPFVGAGLSGYYFKENPNDSFHRNNVFSLHVGILNNFRLTDNWSLFAELQVIAQAWSPNLSKPEGLFGASAYGFATPLTIGVTYTIGKPARNNRLKGTAMVETLLAKETVTRTQVVEKVVERTVEKIVERPMEELRKETPQVVVSKRESSEVVIRAGQPYLSIHVLYGRNRSLESSIFKGQKPVIKIPDNGKYHYFIGEYTSKSKADKAMLEAKKIFKNPYPVVILNRRFSPFLAK